MVLALAAMASLRSPPEEPPATPSLAAPRELQAALPGPAPPETPWEVEAFHAQAQAGLKKLAAWLEAEDAPAAGELARVFTEDGRVGLLLPRAWPEQETLGGFELKRALEPPGSSLAVIGLEAIGREIEALRESLGAGRRAKFKLFRAEPLPGGALTRVRLEVSGHGGGSRLQHVAEWSVTWRLDAGGERARIAEIQPLRQDAAAAASATFSDQSEAVFRDEPLWAAQLRPGIDHWRERVVRQLGMLHHGHHGLAIGDADGDGREDLYACQPGGLPNRLLLQQPDGTVRDGSGAAGLDFLDYSSSSLFFDADGDGDQDLFVATSSALVGLANDGRGHFEVRMRLEDGAGAYSLAAADADGDGDLDLYLSLYFLLEEGDALTVSPMPLPYHDARNGGPNVYLRNDGDWAFTDATSLSGLDEGNDRFSFAASWEDYDDDGDPDLYVANDFGRNNLYRNEGGRFRDVAAAAGVEDLAAGMSVAWGDPNRDGRLDLHVGNMFSAAGGRIAHQPEFQSALPEGERAGYRRHARGNSLFRNLGGGRFEDVSQSAGVSFGRWSWGAAFADIDNDGWEDLLVTNGFVTGPEEDDL